MGRVIACPNVAAKILFLLLAVLITLAVPAMGLKFGVGPDMSHLDKDAFEDMLKQPHEPHLSHYELAMLEHAKHRERNGHVNHEPWWTGYSDCESDSGRGNSSGSSTATRTLKAVKSGNSAIMLQGLKSPPLQSPSTTKADVNSSLSSFDSIITPLYVDWRNTSAMTTVKSQFQCGSCWALASVDLVSIAMALQQGLGSIPAPPLNPDGTVPASITKLDLSAQQVCNCAADVDRTCCKGGWPEWALQYILYIEGIVSAEACPYYARNDKCVLMPSFYTQGAITGWELIKPRSVNAVKNAVAQAGPVLAYVAAASKDFQSYSGGVYNGSCTGDISHVVLIVGYGTDPVAGPYWILKNSWGTSWGEKGYMRMAMIGGSGLCGITSAPAISVLPAANFGSPDRYNSPTSSDVCYSTYPPLCGAGTCYVETLTSKFGDTSFRARCACPRGYVENLYGKAKCVSANPCGSNPNPCGPGTCSNNKDGTYSCACGQNAVIGSQTDGSMTCIVGESSYVKSYQLRPSDTCITVATAFGTTVANLLVLNLGLNCSNLVVGANIIVSNRTTTQGCSSAIVVQSGQSCQSIAAAYLSKIPDLIRMNPGLNCNNLLVGQPICVAPGNVQTAVTAVPACGLTYDVGLMQDCQSIQTTFRIDRKTLIGLNPGLNCSAGRLSSSLTLCVAAATSIVAQSKKVNCTKWYLVQHGDKCPNIWLAAGLKASQFFLLNPGLQCGKPYFQVGLNICVAGPQSSSVFANSVPYTVVKGDTLFTISSFFQPRCGTYASPAGICSQNTLIDCSAPLTVGQSLQVPCQWPVGRSCGCAPSQWVCGADGNWYASYCDAACNFATPASPKGCSTCQYGCSGRCGFAQSPSSGTPSWCQSPCPYPPWPPTNWNWFATSTCSFYVQACSTCCMGGWGYGTLIYWNCLAYCKQYKCS